MSNDVSPSPASPSGEFLPRLVAVFFAVFDPSQGPRVVLDVPTGAVTQPCPESGLSLFELTSDYLIPKRALCGRLVSIALRRHKLLGAPVLIDNEERYLRGQFIFNIGFVFAREAELAAYEPLVKKAARVFQSLEARGVAIDPF
jgi:hypothetical protein